ncbi:imelysin family protein [Fulvivirgaceae bacterium BMA10]|uniref:Imelysin family protein n=1 Tax=Splendidivirga corallicola TaxID=3051826 RepID=A0ABT8L0K2_9BACT|nr:imelysin family protein [Fulvivirgaceae bacterium BMA10]
MKLFTKLILTCSVIGCLTLISSCGEDDNPGGDNQFSRDDMLKNLGNNLIIPSYESLLASLQQLQTSIQAFNANPTTGTLSTSRDDFQDAYLKWQRSSFYEFGRAENVLLRASMNSFPTNTITINSNISSGNYNLDAVANINAAGLPAIDYLLNGLADNDQDLLAFYTSDSNAANRKTYLEDLAETMISKVSDVLDNWKASGGNYIQTFINANGTDIGSSLGILVNTITLHYEKFTRDNKIGIPLGVRSLGIPVPANVEARYSEQSIALATENLKAIRDFYLGKGAEDGLGIYDNLKALDAKNGDALLADVISDQLDLVISKVSDIPEPYAETVENNPDPANAAYQELQKLVILFKTDMSSALGVLITYQDNDGD